MWDSTTLGTGSAKMNYGAYATSFDLWEICDRLQGHDYNDNGSTSLAKLLNWVGGHTDSPDVFSRL